MMGRMRDEATFRTKAGLAEMLKGGVIMDVVTAEQAKIAEDAGAAAVMALERVPADIRRDGGATWTAVDDGRDRAYCWALAVDPDDPDRWYVSAASGPGAAHARERARGRLYRWDAGHWQRLALPDETMPYALAATNGDLLVGTSDGRVLRSGDRGERFEDTGLRVASISAMAAPR